MRVINPTYHNIQQDNLADDVQTPEEALQFPVCVFSNSKPNATVFLESIRTGLGATVQHEIGFIRKTSASNPAPVEVLDVVTKTFKTAVVGIGD
ncbi:hypothetical protein LLE49_12565 [Alicyclobacillus tolerans]|uniref:UGSC family (seleno)protein n=1 Tax=Alicyclobacillus tolerans TaxID=90970 RepID=UPI001F38A707|nr:hypothetical protein [Alicyclobacillus tolerans]MCF8565550.1 hypothetical protein [Alicyclobacillus tolerans]